jgi:hypothetical protein
MASVPNKPTAMGTATADTDPSNVFVLVSAVINKLDLLIVLLLGT